MPSSRIPLGMWSVTILIFLGSAYAAHNPTEVTDFASFTKTDTPEPTQQTPEPTEPTPTPPAQTPEPTSEPSLPTCSKPAPDLCAQGCGDFCCLEWEWVSVEEPISKALKAQGVEQGMKFHTCSDAKQTALIKKQQVPDQPYARADLVQSTDFYMDWDATEYRKEECGLAEIPMSECATFTKADMVEKVWGGEEMAKKQIYQVKCSCQTAQSDPSTPEPTSDTSTPEPTNKATPEPTNKATPEPTNKATPEPTSLKTPEPTSDKTPMPTTPAKRTIVKGISYGPVPTKEEGDQPHIDDFMSSEYRLLWGDEGRGDLAIMQKLGANAIRLYGNDPRQDHKEFLDTAHKYGLKVVPGMSNYPFTDWPEHACRLPKFNWDCSSQLKSQYADNLKNGYAQNGAYHPALKEVIIINEPDYKAPGLNNPELFTKAIISALDGMLDAEHEAGITENLVKFTATFSYGICKNCKKHNNTPGLGQMYDLKMALLHPASVGYKPKHDLTKAFHERWVNSLNTAVNTPALKSQFVPPYKEEFKDSGTEWVIGEYHAQGGDYTFNVLRDLNGVLEIAKDETNLLQGISFFEWQEAYNKGGSERFFGMLGLGDHKIADFSPYGHKAVVWCLKSRKDPQGDLSVDKSLSTAYGGEGYDFEKDCSVDANKVKVTADGYKEILDEGSTALMTTFIERLIQRMGGTVNNQEQLAEFAAGYSGESKAAPEDGWAVLTSKLGEKPDFVTWDEHAACVADRHANKDVIGQAIAYVCGALKTFSCDKVPASCVPKDDAHPNGEGDVYDMGDYLFSIFWNEQDAASRGPLTTCNFGGAAMYAPSEVYRKVDRDCVLTNDPLTVPLSQDGLDEMRSENDAGKLATFIERIITSKKEHVSDKAAYDAFVTSVMEDSSLTFQALETKLAEQTFTCGGETGRVCPETPVPTPAPTAATPKPTNGPRPAAPLSQKGLDEVRSTNDKVQMAEFLQRILDSKSETVSDKAAYDAFVTSTMQDSSLTFEALEAKLAEQSFVCGGDTGRACPTPAPTQGPESGSSGPNVMLIVLLVVGAVVILAGGGFFLTRRPEARNLGPREHSNELARVDNA